MKSEHVNTINAFEGAYLTFQRLRFTTGKKPPRNEILAARFEEMRHLLVTMRQHLASLNEAIDDYTSLRMFPKGTEIQERNAERRLSDLEADLLGGVHRKLSWILTECINTTRFYQNILDGVDAD